MAGRAPGVAIPIACVAEVALLAMQIGMNPHAVGVIQRVDAFMGIGPVAPGVAPKGEKRRGSPEGSDTARSSFGVIIAFSSEVLSLSQKAATLF